MLVIIHTDSPYRPGGKGGNGPPEKKFMKLAEKVNFGVLSLKLDAIRAIKGAISLVLMLTVLFKI